MIYYLEDSASRCAICVSDSLSLINNIASGILDNYLRPAYNNENITKAAKHLEENDNIGIIIYQNSLEEVDLTNFEYTREKIRLVKLRKPLFEELLFNVQSQLAGNRIGFVGGDEIYIQYALNNEEAMQEYASVLNMSPEFAKKELKLISESVIKNNFRIFTVATQFKEKINKVCTEEDANAIKRLIQKSFNVAGMVNV